MYDSRYSDRPPASIPSDLLNQEGSTLLGILRFAQAVRERKRIPILCAAVFCAAGLLYYALTPRSYEARAEVLLDGVNGRDDRILTSEPVLGAVATQLTDEKIPELDKLPPELRATHIREHIFVNSPSGRPNILIIRYLSRDPQAAQVILNKLVDRYVTYLDRDLNQKPARLNGSAALRRHISLNVISMLSHIPELQPVEEDEVSLKKISEELQSVSGVAKPSPEPVGPPEKIDPDASSVKPDGIPLGPSLLFQNDIQNKSENHIRGNERHSGQENLSEESAAWLNALYGVVSALDALKNTKKKKETIVLAAPTVPAVPTSPVRLTRVLFFALFLGLFLGLGIVFMLDALDDRFRSPGELCRQLNLPLLGTIHKREAIARAGSAKHDDANTLQTLENQEFQSLRVGLDLLDENTCRFVVTSIDSGDGKTAVSARLAAAFARCGKRTLLIDADFRNRGASRLFEADEKAGLSNFISSDNPVASAARDIILRVGSSRLDFLPCGQTSDDSIGLMTSKRFSELLDWCEESYDQVLIDGPDAQIVTETAVLGKVARGMILVLRPDRTTRSRTVRACRNLNTFGCHLIGVVANLIEPHSRWLQSEGYGFAGTGIPRKTPFSNTTGVGLSVPPDNRPSHKEENPGSEVTGPIDRAPGMPHAA